MHYARLRYGTPLVDFEPSLPLLPWEPPVPHEEGGRSEIGGVIETFTVHESSLLTLRVQLLESEWPAMLAFLRLHRRDSRRTFELWVDRSSATSYIPCTLRAPQIPDPIKPTRDKHLLIQELTVRHATVGIFDPLNFFGV